MSEEEDSGVVGMNPDSFTSGLKDDFRARITGAEYVAWDYEGNKFDDDGNPVLTLAGKFDLEILDDDGEPTGEDGVTQFWSAGDIGSFVPSEDGKEPAGSGPDPRSEDGDDVQFEVGVGGQYAMRVGRRSAFSRSTNWARLLTSVLECGEASEAFSAANFDPSIHCLIGIDAQWNRVPQETRSGLDSDDGNKRDVLVVTEMFGYEPPAKAKSKTTTKGKTTTTAKGKTTKPADPEPDDDDGDELSDTVLQLVTDAISESDGATMLRSKLTAIVKEVDKADRPAALKLVTNKKWLEEGGFTIKGNKVSID